MTRRLKWAPWIALVVIAAVVLAVGSSRGGHPSLQAQTMHLASQVRCPECEGQSAAQSQTASSIQIRNTIHDELAAGESSSQILAGLVAAYGPSILEKPEAKGVGLIVWVAPVVAVILAAFGLSLAFARWRRASSSRQPVSASDRELVEGALRDHG